MLEARALTLSHGGAPLIRGLSLRLQPGDVLGVEGPSGSGKTTLGRALAGLHHPAGGEVLLNGRAPPRGAVQYLHPEPGQAMNPRWRIARIVAEAGRPDPAVAAALGIRSDWAERFPHELSGGELQRVSLLRALTAGPAYLVADEITAPLDPVAQARIWRALLSVASARGIGILAISHDAPLLDRIAGERLCLPPPAALRTGGVAHYFRRCRQLFS